MHSTCKTIALSMHSKCKSVALSMHSKCGNTALNMHSKCGSVALNTHSKRGRIALHMHSRCGNIALSTSAVKNQLRDFTIQLSGMSPCVYSATNQIMQECITANRRPTGGVHVTCIASPNVWVTPSTTSLIFKVFQVVFKDCLLRYCMDNRSHRLEAKKLNCINVFKVVSAVT